MTTQTTTPEALTKTASPHAGLIGIPENVGRALATGGGILTIISAFLAWTWTSAFPGDLTVYGYPGGLRVLVLIGGALTTLFALASYGIKGLGWLIPMRRRRRRQVRRPRHLRHRLVHGHLDQRRPRRHRQPRSRMATSSP